MAEGNGHSRKLPKINVSEDVPDNDKMLSDIWAHVQMTNLKLYGDKEKNIVGITDELKGIDNRFVSLDNRFISLNETMEPLVKDYERRKLLRRWVLIPLTFIGGAVGTWAKNYIETHYLK